MHRELRPYIRIDAVGIDYTQIPFEYRDSQFNTGA